MKKIFLYTMLACMAVSFGSCSDDPMDATEKHVYGENENPYLRTDASATELFVSLLMLITLSFLLLIRTYPKRMMCCLNTL